MKVEANDIASSALNYRPVKAELEQRLLSRFPVRKNEGISAHIYIQNTEAPLELRVIDVSSIGIGLETEEPLAFSFQNGHQVELELICRTNQYRLPVTISYVGKNSGEKSKNRVPANRY